MKKFDLYSIHSYIITIVKLRNITQIVYVNIRSYKQTYKCIYLA